MKVRSRLVMVATVPALIMTAVIMTAAINDMFKMNNLASEHTGTMVAQAIADGKALSADEISQISKDRFAEAFADLGKIAIPLILTLGGLLVGSAIYFVTRITTGLNHVVKGVKNMTSPDTPLSFRIPEEGSNELQPIVAQMNEMLDRIENVFNEVASMSKSIHDSANVLHDNSQSNTANAEQLSANMETVSTAMTQLQSASNEISSHVQRASVEVADVNQDGKRMTSEISGLNNEMDNLKGVISESADDVNDLSNQVEGIYGILQTIQGIAEQTNLLALNAAIEAARAGEQGRGFAVVADEVRNLAGKTQNSTEEIKGMIEALNEGAKRSISAMEQSTQSTDELVTKFTSVNEGIVELFNRLELVNDMNAQVATATEEQIQVIDDIHRNTERTKDLALNTDSSSRSTGEQAEILNQGSQHLAKLMGKFNFD